MTRIEQQRHKRKWSRRQVTRSTGGCEVTLYRIERKGLQPRAGFLYKLAMLFGVPMSSLVEKEWLDDNSDKNSD